MDEAGGEYIEEQCERAIKAFLYEITDDEGLEFMKNFVEIIAPLIIECRRLRRQNWILNGTKDALMEYSRENVEGE
jgi:hypothetical protein